MLIQSHEIQEYVFFLRPKDSWDFEDMEFVITLLLKVRKCSSCILTEQQLFIVYIKTCIHCAFKFVVVMTRFILFLEKSCDFTSTPLVE